MSDLRDDLKNKRKRKQRLVFNVSLGIFMGCMWALFGWKAAVVVVAILAALCMIAALIEKETP